MSVAADAPPRRVAVLIGQNRFPNAAHLTDLSYAEADARAIAELLGSDSGVPYDEIITIPTGTSYEALERLELMAADLRHEDTILVYYSGHGVRDRRRRLYLAFENTNEDRLTSTALQVGQVLDLMQAHNARRRILVLDCCYAGAVGAEFDRSSLPEQIATEVEGAGTVVLTAAAKTEVAKEDPEHGHGIFTRHFLDGLAGAADVDGNGVVTSEELFEYVHRMVSAETAQKPQRFNHEIEGRIVLRETGLTPWKDKADRIRETLFTLARSGQVSDRLLTEALAIAIRQPSTLTAEERKLFHQLERIDPEDFRPGPFANEWDAQMARVAAARPDAGPSASEAPSPAPPPEPVAKPDPHPAPPPGPASSAAHAGAGLADPASPVWDAAPAGGSATAAETPDDAANGGSGSGGSGSGGFGFLGFRSTEPVPAWYANLSLAVYFLFPSWILYYDDSIEIIDGLGTIMFVCAAIGLWSAHSRWSAGALWRKIGYYLLAGCYGLIGFALAMGTY